MATENVVWTLLPNGVHESGDHLRATIFVSPRLTTDAGRATQLTKRSFPAFASWPDTLTRLKFVVRIGSLRLDADHDPDSPVADPDTWKLLFGPTSVGDGTFTDLSTRPLRSFPVAGTSRAILDLYANVASDSPSTFPPVTTGPLADWARQLGSLGDARRDHYARLDGLIVPAYEDDEHKRKDEQGGFVDRDRIAAADRLLLTFAEAYRFYDRPGTRDPVGPKRTPPAPTVPFIDFHGFVAFCGDYPELLRRLGLAIDVVFPLDRRIPAQGKARIEVTVDDPTHLGWMTIDEARPIINYEIAERRFIALSREKTGDLVDGSLRIEDDRFLVNEIDVDGSTLKLADFAATVARLAAAVRNPGGSVVPDAASLPALRSGGFSIARDRRAARLSDHLVTAAHHEADHASHTATELFAEDVNRGYRLDVADQQKPDIWRSLHQRTGTYEVKPATGASTPLSIADDEGYVKGASASETGHDRDLYVHEAMFGWDGWSLAAKRLGLALTDRGAENVESENPTSFPLETSFRPVPGTLPRLRFGRRYLFRVRAVDLAGNSVREGDLVRQHVSRPVDFLRFDPVPSPAIVPRRPYTEGESLIRLVIRSTLGVLPPAYVAQPRIESLVGHTEAHFVYEATNERHLAPPNSSQQLAEWHGRFDVAIHLGAAPADINDQFAIAGRESGSFLDPGPDTFVFNPDPNATPTLLPQPADHKGDPLKPGEVVCHDTDDLALPYLPDLFSRGWALDGLPGVTGADRVVRQPWIGGDWPERRPIRIRIEDGSGPPVWHAAERLLVVEVPQAEQVDVRLSSFLDAADLDQMGIWRLVHPPAGGPKSPAVQAAIGQATRGGHWMLTPFEVISLVHAVEKPLTAPVVAVAADGIDRQAGETFASLAGTIENHAKSTGRLDVLGRWTEPIDDVTLPAPTTATVGDVHVTDFQLAATEEHCRVGRNDQPPTAGAGPMHRVRHELGDTKHRWIEYHAVATTRFREYFPPTITDQPDLITSVGPTVRRNVPSSRRPDPPEVLYVVPTWTWTARTVDGRVPATVRVASTGRSSSAAAAAAAARPTLPSTNLSTRSGGGLRVYLDRPWYSSGDDELLGVVLADQPWFTWSIDQIAGLRVSEAAKAAVESAAVRALDRNLVTAKGRATASATDRLLAGVGARTELSAQASSQLAGVIGHLIEQPPTALLTRWGQDPVWASTDPGDGPFIHQFPLRAAVDTSLSLEEAPLQRVAVVGHQPQYDHDRRLWYCDVQLEAGASYFPFVKLGLVRYQPFSVPGCELSHVVLADFVQLAAERTAAVTRIDRGEVAVSVQGPGGHNHAGVASSASRDTLVLQQRSRFAVAQVERLAAGATTDLAWQPIGDEIHLDLRVGPGTDVTYAGRLPVPDKAQGDQLRLAVREFEIFETDHSQADDTLVRVVDAGDHVIHQVSVRYRLVYADELALG